MDQLEDTHEAFTVIEVDGKRMCEIIEEEYALTGRASLFFNTKVNVSTQEERILTLLMTGLTFRDLYMHVKNGSLSGLPADLTMDGLDRSKYMFAEAKKLPTLGGEVASVMCCLTWLIVELPSDNRLQVKG